MKKQLKKERWYHYPEKAIGLAIVVGSILGFTLIVSAILANQTFGQRCSTMGLDKGSVQWETCIRELQRKH